MIFKPLQFLLKGKCYLSKGLTILEREYEDLYDDFEEEQTAVIIFCLIINWDYTASDNWNMHGNVHKHNTK